MANNTNASANTAENKKENEKVNTNASANTAENKKENEKVNTNASTNTKVVAIPVDPLNKKNNVVKVTINGQETEIIRGKQQKVSKDVYERLVIAGYVIEG